MTTLQLNLPNTKYSITIGNELLNKADEFFNLNRKVFIVTDDGVPREYAEAISKKCKKSLIYTVKSGEASKSFDTLQELCSAMMEFGMTRSDCGIAVGGGVVGDLTGFACAVYMRGIDFYNVPTTMLAQVDSSIGGKTAINLGDTKNIVGAFHQPKAVLIDTDVLKTLSKRHLSAGLAEAVKMSLTSDKELFEIFEKEDVNDENIENIIVKSLEIKKKVVEEDEKESGLRKILNFGHTFGHGIEAAEGLGNLYHGECVALGMIPMCSPSVKKKLISVLEKLNLPTIFNGNVDVALSYVDHDKKANDKSVSAIFVDEIGVFRISDIATEDFKNHIKANI